MTDKRRPRAPTITIDTSAVGDATPQENIQLDSPKDLLAVPSNQGGSQHRKSFDSGSHTYVGSPSRLESFDSTADLVREEEPLKPDPNTEDDFKVEDNKFAFSPGQLSKLFNPKSYAAFHALGGPAGLSKGLRTNLKTGLDVEEQTLDGQVTFEQAVAAAAEDASRNVDQAQPQLVHHASHTSSPARPASQFGDRRRVFSDNRLPARASKSIWQLMWMAYKDKVLLLLSVAAVVSLAIGIYQSTQPGGAPEWVEGVAIIVAIFVVVIVGAANDWQKERQFVKLNKKKDDRVVKVIRSGVSQEIPIFDLMVGDVALLEQGDIMPADGIFLGGHNVSCDESSATGESDLLKKQPAIEVYRAIEERKSVRKLDPFILSGSKVSQGVGSFLVTGVGVHSSYGKIMKSLSDKDGADVTPLQSKLNVLAEHIAKLGGAAALLYFVVVFIEFLVRITRGGEQSLSPAEKGQRFLNIFVVAVSVIVVAVPEGLPLAVTLALAFATTRMLKDNNLVRLLRSCETMGVATTVCSDKTGTLTQNRMSVVAGTLGTSSRFGDYKGGEEADGKDQPSAKIKQAFKASKGQDVTPEEFVSTLDPKIKSLMEQSVVINSTAFEGEEEGRSTFIGSKTDTALLSFARDHLGMGDVSIERGNAQIEQFVPFDSGRKSMAAVVRLPSGVRRMYVKGASEILLAQSSRIIKSATKSQAPPPPDSDDSKAHLSEDGISAAVRESTGSSQETVDSVDTVPLTSENVEVLQHIISTYASRSLRTIAMLYRDFESWPPRGCRKEDGQVVFEDLFKEMTFLGVVGIQDPLRPGVTQAVADCKRAGVFVRMVTGDNLQTAKAIAAECGILTQGGEAIEGPDFRRLGETELNEKLPRLQVLARSSPEDKKLLVKRLKELGGCVAVTGDGTNDAPALKNADVGFSMGIGGTEVAKEASAIILMDDNFSSIVKALMWGRAVNDAVKKFLQFQVTVNITAVLLTFVSGVASSSGDSVLTAVQLLWVNLIMDTMAALALATDPPPTSILDRPPDKKFGGLISLTMWKMIIGQAIYQIVVTFVLYFRGAQILSYQSDHEKEQLQTLVFNTFVWMQIFNAFNNRRLDNRFNIFEGVWRNYLFILMLTIMMGGQVLIVFVGGDALSTVPLNGAQWAYSIVLGVISLPIAVILRLVPDEAIRATLPQFLTRLLDAETPNPDLEASRKQWDWNPALNEVRNELLFLKKFKGGRLNTLRFKMHQARESTVFHPGSRPNTNRSRSSTNTAQHTPAAAMAAGIVAGSIGGWSPVERKPEDRDKPFP